MKVISNQELLKEYLKEVDTLSKALKGDATQWYLEDHKLSVDKLCNIAEEILAITDIIVKRKNWSTNQIIVPDDNPVAQVMANKALELQTEVKTKLDEALQRVRTNMTRQRQFVDAQIGWTHKWGGRTRWMHNMIIPVQDQT